MSIAIWHKAAQSIGISHHLPCVVAARGHGGTCLQRTAGSRGDGAAAVDVANGLPELLPVVLPCLLGTKEGAQVGEPTRRRGRGDDEGPVAFSVAVQGCDAAGPGDLSADVAIVDSHGDAAIDHKLSLCEHVRARHVDDAPGTLHKVNNGVRVVIRHLHHWGILPNGAGELPIPELLHPPRRASGEGKGEAFRGALQGHALQVLHHQISGVPRDPVEDQVVLGPVPGAAPIVVLVQGEVLIIDLLCIGVILVLHEPAVGRGQRFILHHELVGEIHGLEGRGHLLIGVVGRHGESAKALQGGQGFRRSTGPLVGRQP
mmetsp:Transcript_65327/g.156007  ORF Transcript_65327/g.156007 Transcript_65327/m.156007 type:complete len:316 (-) Transcript_65327:13-960(-)